MEGASISCGKRKIERKVGSNEGKNFKNESS